MRKRNLPEMDVMRSADLLIVAATPGGDRVVRPAPVQRKEPRR